MNEDNLNKMDNEDAGNSVTSKKVAKKQSGFKKVLISSLCGIVFGIFAAISFYAVKEIGDAFSITNKAGNENINKNIIASSSDVESSIDRDVVRDDVETPLTESINENINKIDNKNDNSHVKHENTYDVALDIPTVVENKMPTIVSIINHYTVNSFWGGEYEQEASGSGIIIGSNDDEILIVTNYHVVANNKGLEVTFCDSKVATAQVKGTDEKMDLAVIAVLFDDVESSTKNAIDYAIIGDSDKLRVGEGVIAIGNSLGYGQSVTTGVVSAINREIEINGVKGTFIQTDAAINPGNSGGALMNHNGEVIGINSSKIGGSTVEGMGYAIPISAAKPIIEDLMQRETKVPVAFEKQGYLGISGATITQDEAEFYGYPVGVYVANVYENSPAEKAGIQKGDFITSLNGETITSMEQLKKELSYYEGGSTVSVVVERYSVSGYKEMTMTVKLGFKNEVDNG